MKKILSGMFLMLFLLFPGSLFTQQKKAAAINLALTI